MYGLPQKLYTDVQKLSNGQETYWAKDSMFGVSQGVWANYSHNTFYSIKDGNWTDPATWENIGNRVGNFPGQYDDVYIRHTVTLNNATGTDMVNNLFVSGTMKWGNNQNKTFQVLGNIQATGIIDMSAITVTATNAGFYLYGNNNFIKTFLTGGNVGYMREGDQLIMDLPYSSLSMVTNSAICTKYLTANTTVSGALLMNTSVGSVRPTLECGIYNLNVVGASVCGGGIISKKGAGTVTFGGLLSFINNLFAGIDFSLGNPDVEVKGGITLGAQGANLLWNTGTGNWNFTTNNQTFSNPTNTATAAFDAVVNVVGVTVTNTSLGVMQINNALDGTTGSSFINKGLLYFNTTTAAMLTAGTLDVTSFANTVGYVFNGNQNVEKAAYSSLYIAGTGIKSLLQTTTVAGTLLTAGNSSLQLSTYDFTVSSTTTLNGSILKSGTGNVLFIGQIIYLTSSNTYGIDFSAGNPTVECRGGIFSNQGGVLPLLVTGTGQWKFSTNSQSIKAANGGSWTFNCPILISGAITLTFDLAATNNLNNTINGDNVASALVNKAVLNFNSTASLPSMTTGTVNFTSFSNTVGYTMNGNITIPYTGFNGLTISGTGTKTLSGDTSISGVFTMNTNSILDASIYNLNVNSTCSLSGRLIKSGAGNILFVGLITTGGGGINCMDFTGNPTVEMRGGLFGNGAPMNLGTGLWTFSTNNQSFATSNAVFTFAGGILISGAITLTVAAGQSGNITATGTIDGNNAASTLDNRGIVNYKNAIQPMVTGVLQTNAAANTWLYNLNGAQDIKGGTYRTLTLSVGGVKTLQGNVVVATLYTLSAPATLNLNGFTRT